MDEYFEESSRCLPATSRVNEEILNYYRHYGRDRDLEKFMRLYSPTSREGSRCPSSSSSGSSAMFRRLFNSRESVQAMEQRAERHIPIHCVEAEKENRARHQEGTTRDKDIPIVVLKKKVLAVSCEDLQTPEKSKRAELEARTPESITKSMKRLEWDSLGDVGYRKSMSASNISVLERSLLKELFQTSENANASETEANKSDEPPSRHAEAKETTQPLASSTFTDSRVLAEANEKGSTRQYTSQCTNTTQSLQKIHDRSAQTSHRFAPSSSTRDSQSSVSLRNFESSSGLTCGTATPSSFEYYSSNHSRHSGSSSRGTEASRLSILRQRNEKVAAEEQLATNDFVANINKMMAEKRQKAKEKADRAEKQRAAKKIIASEAASTRRREEALRHSKESKENISVASSALSLAKPHSQQDLVVQMLSALIEAKSLTLSEKKHLIRDIVKRISGKDEACQGPLEAASKENVSGAANEKSISKSNSLHSSKSKRTNSQGRTSKESQTTAKAEEPKQIRVRGGQDPAGPRMADKEVQTEQTEEYGNSVEKATTSTISTSSQEQITQKAVYAAVHTTTVEESIAMDEWLKPMTQSELQYEGKVAYNIEEVNQSEGQENERDTQLHWIDSEIKRLEGLRHLLAKEHGEAPEKRDRAASGQKVSTKKATKKTGSHSGSSSTSTSHGYTIVAHKTKDPKKDEKASDPESSPEVKKRDPKEAGQKKRNLTPTKGQVSSPKSVKTRSKIDTPTSSIESVSVCSFVRQRKTEFIEQYRIKKAFLHEQRRLKQPKQASPPKLEKLQINNHYSLPNTMQRGMQHRFKGVQQQAISLQSIPIRHEEDRKGQAAAAARHVSSESTLFYTSSEMSVPMGNSNTTSSTTTTTHKYDDVAGAGVLDVAVQTSNSVMRSYPIYGQRGLSAMPQHVPFGQAPNGVSVQVKPKSIAYVITFDQDSAAKDNKTDKEPDSSSSFLREDKEPMTLQEHLQRARPKFVAHTQERQVILNEIHALREARGRQLQEMMDTTSVSSLEGKVNRLPPPPTTYLRIFPTKEMKSMTKKRVTKLPEVLDKKERSKEERRRRNNRMLKDLFNKRLQKRVRTGKLSLNHSRTVI